MIRKKAARRTATPNRIGALPHIYVPHHSWTQRDTPPKPAERISADDFWTKLGL